MWDENYRFEIEFQNGRLDSRTLPTNGGGRRVDQQRPPAHFGLARWVRLIPLNDDFPALAYPIPQFPGVTPVCHRHRHADAASGALKGTWYRIGFAYGGQRWMVAINAATKAQVNWFDNNGPTEI